MPGLAGVTLSVHCHNDLGLAVANSLASVRAGARQVETCVNGIGERAGNAALEEVAMATRLHPEVFGVATQLDHSQLYRTSRLVSQLTGMVVQPNKAVVGANAFAHHSGIHQDGILKDPRTFEIMDAAEVGAGSTLVLGKLSGRHALRNRLEQLGYMLDDEELKRAFVRFKELADRKRDVTDRDLEAVVADELRSGEERYHLEHLQVSCGTRLRPTATVRMLLPDGLSHEAAAIGDGPVDAAYRAINSLCQVEGELEEFAVQAVTAGIDAIGEVSVRLHRDGVRAAGTVPTPTSSWPPPRHTCTPSTAWPRVSPAASGPRPRPRGRRRPAADDARTLFDKVWDAHTVVDDAGGPSLLYIDLHLVHEVTSPQAFEGLRMAGRTVRRPDLTVATMDHNVPTIDQLAPIKDQVSAAQVEALRRNCADFGIACYGVGHRWQGIVHVIGPELGLTLPGTTIVCGDSHTATHGAFGALAFGIGTTDVEHVLATQTLRAARPRSMEVRIDGELPPWVTAKDVALGVVRTIGTAGARGHVVEYTGRWSAACRWSSG